MKDLTINIQVDGEGFGLARGNHETKRITFTLRPGGDPESATDTLDCATALLSKIAADLRSGKVRLDDFSEPKEPMNDTTITHTLTLDLATVTAAEFVGNHARPKDCLLRLRFADGQLVDFVDADQSILSTVHAEWARQRSEAAP